MMDEFTVSVPPARDSNLDGGLLIVKVEGQDERLIKIPRSALVSSGGELVKVTNPVFKAIKTQKIEAEYYELRQGISVSTETSMKIEFSS